MEAQTVKEASSCWQDEWYQLVNWLLENFTEDELQTVMFFYSSEKMEVDSEDMEKPFQQAFYDTIDFDDDKMQAAIKLKNVMEALQYHSTLGENVADKIASFITQLKAYRKKFDVETQQLFIGREEEVKIVTDILKGQGTISAVSLCGIGGQGKSSLATHVCKKLEAESSTLNVVKADLRNKMSIEDVLKSVLASASVKFPSSGDQNILESILEQFITESNSDILFCLDDCDQVLKTYRRQFLSFLENFLQNAAESRQKVCLLLTMREKLPDDGKEVEKYMVKMSGRLAEVELHELEPTDAELLLRTCSEVDMDKHIATAIVKECAGSPLAISVVADLVKSGKFTPDRLLFHLQMDKKNVTKGLKVDHCVKEAIGNLNLDLQKALVCLSVFQASPFEMADARKVIEEPDNQVRDLYKCHLIEVEGSTDDVSKKRYSLHPLVYRYISEWKKPRDLTAVYKQACQKFVSLYESIISSIVVWLESKYWKGCRKLEFHKVHILKFYEIMSEHPELLKDHPKKTDDKGLLVKKRISDLADILLSLVQNRRMFQSEADRAIKQKNSAVYIFWMVEKADVFLMLHDKVEIALEILDQLSDKYPALRDLREEPFHPCLVHGLFHKVKGLCRWKQHLHQQALEHLQLSVKFYEQCQLQFHRRRFTGKTPYDIFIARIMSYMGQVYLDNGDLNDADDYLRKGIELTKEMVETRARETDEFAKELHWDIPRYYSHFARIKIIKAKAAMDQDTRTHLLDNALQDLERGLKLDENLKLNYLDGYYAKMKLRADINVEKGLLKEALEEAEIVLDKRRAILQPPHTRYTESVYQVGRIYMLIGNDLDIKGEKEAAGRYWKCSSDYFKELKDSHLKDGGISIHNPVFQDIKRDHIQVTELTGNKNQVKQIEVFYKRVEAGDYAPEKASSVAAVKKMLWTPVEMLKKFYDGGGKQFGDNDQALTKMENLAREQHDRMLRGEPSGGDRRDSGRGHSSSDLGESLSSGSGSMSDRMGRLHLEKSVSIEDEVFQGSGETAPVKASSKTKKRQKTIDENREA